MLAIFRISITILWPLCQGFVPFHNNFVATVPGFVPNFVAPEHFAREPFLASSSRFKRWTAMTEDEGLWAQHCHGWHYMDRSVAEPKAHGPVLQASSKVKAVKTIACREQLDESMTEADKPEDKAIVEASPSVAEEEDADQKDEEEDAEQQMGKSSSSSNGK